MEFIAIDAAGPAVVRPAGLAAAATSSNIGIIPLLPLCGD
jgi:hypothetical protein